MDGYSIGEAAKLLNREPDTLRKYAQEQKIPASKVLGRWVLPKKWVDQKAIDSQNFLWNKVKTKFPKKDTETIHKKQNAHIKLLQQLAIGAVDLLPDIVPDLEDLDSFESFNTKMVKIFHRLTLDHQNWESMAAHLGEEAKRIEQLSNFLDEFFCGGSNGKPSKNYRENLFEAWQVIKTGGIKTISETNDERAWQYNGLIPRCKACPDQSWTGDYTGI